MKLGVLVSDYKLKNDLLDRIKAEKLGIILVANGVYHAALQEDGKPSFLLDKTPFLYVLSDDLKARGIDTKNIDNRIKIVDYDNIVDLIFNDYEKIIWL
ncbi:MAG: sulfurtransferase complex subunit TusB [Nitrospiraceae bacterium]|nr:sulfurtransferase complex subunit TusB [Nitrospiraceae bacterium]